MIDFRVLGSFTQPLVAQELVSSRSVGWVLLQATEDEPDSFLVEQLLVATKLRDAIHDRLIDLLF